MTEMFNARRRQDVLDRLFTFFQSDSAIVGLVLVGSAAEAEPDNFSGLDFIVVVANGAVFPSVFRKWRTRISEILPVQYEHEAHSAIDSGAVAMMLNDYLEITLYFVSLKNLVVDQSPWQVLFDQTTGEDITDKLEHSFRREKVTGPVRTYQQMMESIWQPIVKCVAAINRGELWRALHMIERIRNQTIELAAINYGVDIRNYAEIDQLPEMLLVKLRHTIPTGVEVIAIRRALQMTCDLFFMQASLFEENIPLRLSDTLRDKMLPYIQAFA